MSSKEPKSYSSLLLLADQVEKKPKPFKKVNVTNKVETSSKVNRRSRSRSPKNKKMKPSNTKASKEEEVDWDIPDRQYGDLYCKPCDSHMNSEQMWEAHIQGKRHLKNVKKGEVVEFKYDYVDEDPIMINQLNTDTRPIVGLQHLVEIQRLEQRPIYQCFLCSANVPSAEQLLEHIVGTKHRLAYLKEHDPERHALIQKSNLKKGHIEPVVEECIQKHEVTIGRGRMLVKREREDYQSPPRKTFKPDYSNNAKLSKSNRVSAAKNLDWDKAKSKKDRSFDSYDDRSSQGRLADRDDSYYNRSDGFAENYNRPGYNDRSTDLPSGNNYKNIEKSKFVDDRYGDSRYPLEEERSVNLRSSVADDRYGSTRSSDADDRYGSSRPPVTDDRYGSTRSSVADDRYGSTRSSVADDRYGTTRSSGADDRYVSSRSNTAEDRYARSLVEEEKTVRYRTSLDEDRYGDLREVLEKKKTLADPFVSSRDPSIKDVQEKTFSNALASSISSPVSTGNSSLAALTGSIPDAYLKMIEAMSPTVFLQLALFKINRIEINNELDLKLLDKLSSICTALSMEIKASQLPTNLQEQFKETMVQSGLGVSPQFAKDFQQMMEMVGQAKANSKPVNSEANSVQKPNYEMQYHNPVYNNASHTPANAASNTPIQQRSSPVYSTPATNKNTGFSWQHVDSTQTQPVALNAYSTTSHIPGLTLTNESTAPMQSPFDLLARQAKDILGGIRTNTDSYRY